MAVTKIWAIRGRIDHVLNYTMNDEKTKDREQGDSEIEFDDAEIQSLYDVMNYAMDDAKTEERLFVTGVNCDAENARSEMIKTKEQFDKKGGIVAFHMYQSFRPEEGPAELIHEIGLRLAEEMFGDRFEVVVATHCNTSCLHNHIVANSISKIDGKRFYDQRKTMHQLREISDRLCREYGLSVIEKPMGRGKNYSEWMAEQNGGYTKNTLIKRDIDECVAIAANNKDFYRLMGARGYHFDFSGKYATVYHPAFPKTRRLKTLGEEYTPEAIRTRIYKRKNRYELDIPQQDDPEQFFFDGDRNNPEIFSGFRSVYVHFVFGLGKIRERQNYNREVLHLLWEEERIFDKRVEEQNLMLDNDLYTDEDVKRYKGEAETEFAEVTEARTSMRNSLKRAVRAGDAAKQNELKSDISFLSERLAKLRRDMKICDRILAGEPKVEAQLQRVKEYTEKFKRRESERNEHIGRRR